MTAARSHAYSPQVLAEEYHHANDTLQTASTGQARFAMKVIIKSTVDVSSFNQSVNNVSSEGLKGHRASWLRAYLLTSPGAVLPGYTQQHVSHFDTLSKDAENATYS